MVLSGQIVLSDQVVLSGQVVLIGPVVLSGQSCCLFLTKLSISATSLLPLIAVPIVPIDVRSR